MGAILVTATDTGVGKTFCCGLLLHFLRSCGVDCGYQKWVATGSGGPLPEDLETCLRLAGLPAAPARLDSQVPYRFTLPASPHLAAAQEGREVDAGLLRDRFRAETGRHNLLVVEGVGGILVPLRRDLLLADFAAELALPVLVVVRSGLGTINHTLLTLEALRCRRVPILGVLATDSGPAEEELIVRDNLQVIAELGRVEVFGRLPWAEEPAQAREGFALLGQRLLARLRRQGLIGAG